jgi:Lrp/AsnC family leucine-responsive transcriptional regulator
VKSKMVLAGPSVRTGPMLPPMAYEEVG